MIRARESWLALCRLGISAITVWEAAMLEAKGRITFRPDPGSRLNEMLTRDLCSIVPLRPEIAIASTRLASFHGDPADRMIVATALSRKAKVKRQKAKVRAEQKEQNFLPENFFRFT